MKPKPKFQYDARDLKPKIKTLMTKDTYDYMRKATKKAVKEAGIKPKDLADATNQKALSQSQLF
jgi:hypothetical protein